MRASRPTRKKSWVRSTTSGLVGYGTARGQRSVELKRLEVDAATAVRAREDAVLQDRGVLYREYLAAVDQLPNLLSTPDTVTPEEVDLWWKLFQRADTEVEIYGSEDARKATYPIYDLMQGVVNRLNAADDLPQAAGQEGRNLVKKVPIVRQAMLDAIRADLHRSERASGS